MSLNHIEFGRDRDNKIVRTIEKGGAFTRKQLQRIFVPKKKSGIRIMQNRLQRLYELERINKSHPIQYEPCIYFTKKPKRLEHTLLINEVYCALLEQKHALHRLNFEWSYSIMGGEVVADAMITLYTDPDKKNRQVIWLEVERSPSKKFDKVEKYSKIFAKTWKNEPWAVVKNDIAYFPTVLIVTDEELTITAEKPRFKVCTNEQVQKDIYSIILRKELF